MQALILAAGMGKRLRQYTENNTKCMVEVAGQTIIKRTVDALKSVGIKKLIIVTGYNKDSLKEYIKENIKGMDIVFIDNDIYYKTNNIYSLYLAREFLKQDDTILLESDLIFDKEIIRQVVNTSNRDVAVVAKYEDWMDGTVTLLDEEDNIVEFVEKSSFSFENIDLYYKTINIYKFSKEFSKNQYIPFLKAYIDAYGKNEYYELVLKAIAHLSKTGIKALKLASEKWYEIDNPQDLDIANALFSEGEEKYNLYTGRFGGYWRFPNMKDFMYLVNPYFPSKNLISKMKQNFYELISQYPSGMKTQQINAARIFEISPEYILVTNGAAETINYLNLIIKGSVALHIPTFNEYERCLNQDTINKILTYSNNFQMNVSTILDKIDEVDNLILINPENPSGSFIKYDDMIKIIQKCKYQDKKIVVDESFIDFASKEEKYTLIDNEILERFNNLIVIKSISKSYGIPGLRLGVIACGNRIEIANIKESLPIWNINSFAEYFLQVMDLYKSEYDYACIKIAIEREEFSNKLRRFEFLEIYESQANYILCKVEKPYTSKKICVDLLNRYNILLKDLSDKQGFEGQEFLRISIRDREDNEYFINSLKELYGGYK